MLAVVANDDRWVLGLRDWRVERDMVMEELGRGLYEVYLAQFQTAFAPRWDDLSEFSKTGWANTAKIFLETSNGTH